MTRQEIKAFIRNYLGETQGSAGSASPLLLDTLISTAADDVARATRCMYYAYTCDLTSGQAEYCPSPLIQIKSVSALDNNGNVVMLTQAGPGTLDRSGDSWRVSPDTGTPSYYLTEGGNRVRLYPVPDYTIAGGLTVEGYGIPGTGITNASWDSQAAPCPLPTRAHMAVLWRAMYLWCGTNPKRFGAVMPLAQSEWKKEQGYVEQEQGNLTAPERHAGMIGIQAGSASY